MGKQMQNKVSFLTYDAGDTGATFWFQGPTQIYFMNDFNCIQY